LLMKAARTEKAGV